jgi:hypothetical protein
MEEANFLQPFLSYENSRPFMQFSAGYFFIRIFSTVDNPTIVIQKPDIGFSDHWGKESLHSWSAGKKCLHYN